MTTSLDRRTVQYYVDSFDAGRAPVYRVRAPDTAGGVIGEIWDCRKGLWIVEPDVSRRHATANAVSADAAAEALAPHVRTAPVVWHEASPPDRSFSARLPGPPMYHSLPPGGDALMGHQWSAVVDGCQYVVAVRPLDKPVDPAVAGERLETAAGNAIGDGNPSARYAIQVGATPGLEQFAEIRKGRWIRSHSFIDGDRFFELTIQGSGITAIVADQFLESFRILPRNLGVTSGAAHLPPEWQVLRIDQCACSVAMPGTPSARLVARPEPGMPVWRVDLALPAGSGAMRLLCRQLTWDEDADECLRRIVAGLVREMNGTLAATTVCDVGGHAGCEARIAITPTHVARVRLAVIDDRFYELRVTGLGDLVDGPDGDRFLQSFTTVALPAPTADDLLDLADALAAVMMRGATDARPAIGSPQGQRLLRRPHLWLHGDVRGLTATLSQAASLLTLEDCRRASLLRAPRPALMLLDRESPDTEPPHVQPAQAALERPWGTFFCAASGPITHVSLLVNRRWPGGYAFTADASSLDALRECLNAVGPWVWWDGDFYLSTQAKPYADAVCIYEDGDHFLFIPRGPSAPEPRDDAALHTMLQHDFFPSFGARAVRPTDGFE
jgi:hypothetical protein